MLITNAVQTAFPDNNNAAACSGYYSEHIERWSDIYSGRPPWETVKKSTLTGKGNRTLSMLNTGKVLCDYLSDLTFSEQCDIVVNDERYQRFLNDTLNRCGFWKFLPEFISKAYALGGGALKIYANNGEIAIDYVSANDFVPTAWTGNDILAGAFRTLTHKGNNFYSLMELMRGDHIEHKLFKSASERELGKECSILELYENIPESITISGLKKPLFSYFRPNFSNNIPDSNIPLGISAFANAADTLKALDIAFDSFSREFVLGKKRIIVPASSVQTVVDTTTGETVKYFDADDEAFVALKTDDTDNLKIVDNTVELRVEQHVSAINALLNILCLQVGISAGSLSFDAVQGMKTATEVVSQESKTQRTVKGNKNVLTEAIENTVRSIFTLAVALGSLPYKEYDLTVGWQDNVIVDDNTLIDNNIKLVSSGLKSKVKAIMEVQKCDEATAREELERMSQESGGGSIADFFGGDEA